MNSSGSTGKLLTSVVVVLLVVVGIQGVILMKLYKKSQERPATVAPSEAAPRLAPGVQGAAPSPPPRSRPQQPAWPQPPNMTFRGPMFQDDWNPFEEMERMRQEMDQLFGNTMNRFRSMPGFNGDWDRMSFAPEMDLQDEGDHYTVRLDIPGAEKSKINVEVHGGMLRVSGTSEETVDEDDGGRVLRMERRSGHFERAITLPGPADESNVEATYENGVLTITIPKAAEAPKTKNVMVL